MSSQTYRRVILSIAIIGITLLLMPFLVFRSVKAQSPLPAYDITEQCFAVADEMVVGATGKNSLDALVRLNRTNGQTTVIGMTGTQNIEAIAFGPLDTLYATDGGRLGTLDLNIGQFTAKPQPLGAGNGSQGVVQLNDADGLFYDVANNILWGVQRVSGKPDVLFQIDPATGAHVANAFGAGKDYVEIQPPRSGTGTLGDVDDIAIDPVEDVLYGAANNGGTGGILVMIDRMTGATTPVAEFRYPIPYANTPTFAGQVVDDIEGLSFFNDVQLYGSTGNNGPDNNDKNQLFMLDKSTGAATRVGAFPAGHMDYEGLACLTAPAFISLKKLTNGEDANTPTGPSVPVGSPVTWTYIITNTGSITLTDLVLTDDQEGLIGPGGLSNCPPAGTILGPGDSLTCTATGVAQLGQYVNTGVVTGTTQVGVVTPRQTVTATDPSHYVSYALASVGNIVFGDIDPTGATPDQIAAGNGLQDAGEIGIDGIIVKLYSADNTFITETVTADGGHYLFTNLPPGAYYLVFVNPFTEGVWTVPDIGADDEVDSDASTFITDPLGQAQRTEVFTLDAGEVDLSWDAGLIGLSSTASAAVGDFVWFDLNKDGIQDSGETGFAGILVRLINADTDTIVKEATTNATGRYLFTGLNPGNYRIEFVILPGFTISPQDAGADDEKDSDLDPTTKRTIVFNLPSFATDLRWDAGIFQTGTGLTPDQEPSQFRSFLPLVNSK